MTRRTTGDTGRRLYAEPVARPEPDLRRLVELVLHLADSQPHATVHPHTADAGAGTSTPTENEAAT